MIINRQFILKKIQLWCLKFCEQNNLVEVESNLSDYLKKDERDNYIRQGLN